MVKTKKISSYQKMKQRYEKQIQELNNDIVVLVEKKDFLQEQSVRLRWTNTLALEKMYFIGSATAEKSELPFIGLLSNIKNENTWKTNS